jgi:hypothetical protein
MVRIVLTLDPLGGWKVHWKNISWHNHVSHGMHFFFLETCLAFICIGFLSCFRSYYILWDREWYKLCFEILFNNLNYWIEIIFWYDIGVSIKNTRFWIITQKIIRYYFINHAKRSWNYLHFFLTFNIYYLKGYKSVSKLQIKLILNEIVGWSV